MVIRNLDELLELARIDFGPIHQRIAGLPDYEPGQILGSDVVITRGTGRYRKDKREGE